MCVLGVALPVALVANTRLIIGSVHGSVLNPVSGLVVFVIATARQPHYKSKWCTFWSRDAFCYRIPAPLGARSQRFLTVPTKTRLDSSIKKFKPRAMYDWVVCRPVRSRRCKEPQGR